MIISIFSSFIFGIALLIFDWIIFLDLKKGPIFSKILPLRFEDNLGPKILNITKLKIANENVKFYKKKNLDENVTFLQKKESVILKESFFFQSDEVCEVSYKDRGGKYQGQKGVTLPKAWLNLIPSQH